jgi:hypothetical protein
MNGDSFPGENDMDGIEQLLDLVHIMIMALLQNTAGEQDFSHINHLSFAGHRRNPELAAQVLGTLVESAELFPMPIRIDLYGGIFSVFEGIIMDKTITTGTTHLFLGPYRQFCTNMRDCSSGISSVKRKVMHSLVSIILKLVHEYYIRSPTYINIDLNPNWTHRRGVTNNASPTCFF